MMPAWFPPTGPRDCARMRAGPRRSGILRAVQRALLSLLLVFSLAWQSVATAAPAWSFGPSDEASHGAMHDQAEDHHHHVVLPDADGIPGDPGSHPLADHFSGSAVLPEVGQPSLPQAPRFPGACDSRAAPQPHLEGPLRPPRLAA